MAVPPSGTTGRSPVSRDRATSRRSNAAAFDGARVRPAPRRGRNRATRRVTRPSSWCSIACDGRRPLPERGDSPRHPPNGRGDSPRHPPMRSPVLVSGSRLRNLEGFSSRFTLATRFSVASPRFRRFWFRSRVFIRTQRYATRSEACRAVHATGSRRRCRVPVSRSRGQQ